MDYALIRSVSTYEVHALATPQVKRSLPTVRCCCILQNFNGGVRG
jgi:hypothetical protein